MSKQLKQTIVLLIVLAALVGCYFGVTKYTEKKNNDEAASADTAKEVVLDISPDDIVSYTYSYEGVEYTYVKENDTWYYADDKSLTVTEYKVSNMLNNLAPFIPEAVITNVTDMAEYELDKLTNVVHWTMKDGTTYSMEIGGYNSTTYVYYVRFTGEDTVYAVNSTTVSLFNKNIYDLTDLEKPEE